MKYVFITGAAQGIGLATARRFADLGWFTGLYDLNGQGVAELLASGNFPSACGCACDVTDSKSVRQALDHFSQHSGGRLDLLVNNAGVLSSGKFEEIDPAANDLMIDVNIRGLTQVAQLAFPLLQQTPGACLLNLCSLSSVIGTPLLAVYSASKFYVDGLTEALNIEWAPYDIRVTSIKPPIINTAMGQQLHPKLTEKLGISMQPAQVAEAIEVAARGNKVSYYLGGRSRLLLFLKRLLPERTRLRLMRFLTGY
jgi:NAD(P)-dependent dehydrogenase (short-subunit alcohol dehydrogenase family)